MKPIYLFPNKYGAPWFQHEDGRTAFGRLHIYWWWPNRKWELAVSRFWVGGRNPNIVNQTNYVMLRAGPFEVMWWRGA